MNINAVHRTMTALPLIAMLALAGCGGGGSTSMGVSPDAPTTPVDMGLPEIDVSQFLNTAIAQGTAPGMIAAILDVNGVKAIGASGVRRQGSPEPITVNDIIHIGSDTKAMTSTMLATLVEDGTFANGWDTTIADVFPELLGTIHQDFNSVTLSQLVRMKSGISRNAMDWRAYSSNADIAERRYNILRDNLSTPPAGPVGDHLYSNLSYMVAGAMAERLTGKSWEILMEERLFTPLGITTAGFGPPGTPGGVDQPWGHRSDGKDGWVPNQFDNDPALGPAGRVHISIEDWAKFISLWFVRTIPVILDRQSLDQLRTPETGTYAAGWNVVQRSWANGIVIIHSGSNTNWQVFLRVLPNRGLAYLAVANASDHQGDRGVNKALNSIIDDLIVSEIQSHVASIDIPGRTQDHVIQMAQEGSPTVAAIRDSSDSVVGLKVGDTSVLIYHRLGNVRGTLQRPTVGSILQNEDVRIRHIYSHWDKVRDVLSPYEHIAFGAWATIAPETGGNADFDYRYEDMGGGYLTALDSARTPAAEMAMSGTATYAGQYTGFLKAHGPDGAILRSTGDVDITADFANSSLLVEMLSTRGNALSLSGLIQGSSFAGTTIERLNETPVLQAAGATASMEGGFYGGDASEAGGVFEVVGGRSQDPGRFIGAFGGKTTN